MSKLWHSVNNLQVVFPEKIDKLSDIRLSHRSGFLHKVVQYSGNHSVTELIDSPLFPYLVFLHVNDEQCRLLRLELGGI